MNAPAPAGLMEALEATWPAATRRRKGPWTLRDGRGGGKRVSAATAEAAVQDTDIDAAEAEMRAMGQTPLFRLHPGMAPQDAALDRALAERGYLRIDPTLMYLAPLAGIAGGTLSDLRSFAIWPPLAIQRAIWTEGGIGPARHEVMARAQEPKTALMARQADRVAGSAFVACHDGIAMLHAMEIAPALRRQGAARNLTRAAAAWATEQGAAWLALAVTEANGPARTLYATLGMEVAASYHYRQHPSATTP